MFILLQKIVGMACLTRSTPEGILQTRVHRIPLLFWQQRGPEEETLSTILKSTLVDGI